MRKNHEKIAITISLVASLVLHALLVIFIPSRIFQIEEKDKLANPKLIEAFLMDFPQELEKEKMSVVDLLDDEKTNYEKPRDTKYVSDKDRSIEKETKAKNPTHKPSVKEKTSQEMESNRDSKKHEESKREESIYYTERQNEDTPKKEDKKNIDLYPDINNELSLNQPYDPNYLEELEEGDRTRLNTREFLYSGYFARVKRQISGHWNPQKAFQEIMQTKRSPGDSISTELTITIDKEGNLRGLDISKASDYPAWDEEALRAIRAAEPFRNPPEAMFGKNDLYTFNFGFIGSFNFNFFYKRIERM